MRRHVYALILAALLTAGCGQSGVTPAAPSPAEQPSPSASTAPTRTPATSPAPATTETPATQTTTPAQPGTKPPQPAPAPAPAPKPKPKPAEPPQNSMVLLQPGASYGEGYDAGGFPPAGAETTKQPPAPPLPQKLYDVDPAASRVTLVLSTVTRGRAPAGQIQATTSHLEGRLHLPGSTGDQPIRIFLRSLTTGDSNQDAALQTGLDTQKEPTAALALFRVEGLTQQLRQGMPLPVRVVGQLTLHGAARPLGCIGTALLQDDLLQVHAGCPFDLTTLQLPLLTKPGVLAVEPVMHLELDLTFAPAP